MEVKEPWAGAGAGMELMTSEKQGEASAVSVGVEGRGARAQPLSRDGTVRVWGPQRGKGASAEVRLDLDSQARALASTLSSVL